MQPHSHLQPALLRPASTRTANCRRNASNPLGELAWGTAVRTMHDSINVEHERPIAQATAAHLPPKLSLLRDQRTELLAHIQRAIVLRPKCHFVMRALCATSIVRARMTLLTASNKAG